MDQPTKLHTTPIDVFVVNTTRNGDAFAVTNEGESVYISPHLVENYDVAQGQHRQVKVAPNNPAHVERGVPWRAFFVVPFGSEVEYAPQPQPQPQPQPAAEPVEPEKPRDRVTDEEVLDALGDAIVTTTAGLAKMLNASSIAVRHTLDRLHKKRQVVRADVYADPDQSKASRALWAKSVDQFYPVEDDIAAE